MNAGSANPSQRLGIYRNTRNGWIAGVCAGIGDRLGIKPIWVRIAFMVVGSIFHAIPAIAIYIVLVLVLEPRSVAPGYQADAYAPAQASPGYFADRFYRGRGGPLPQENPPPPYAAPAGVPPGAGRAAGAGLPEIAARFAALDSRLNMIEAAVMSDELSLRRKFRDLGG